MSKKGVWLVILYVVCFAIIIAAVFCGISLYRKVTAKSYIKGDIDISNQFSQESFYYSAGSVVFYPAVGDTYTYEKELLKVDDFNGAEKKYKVEINDHVIFDTVIKAGNVTALFTMDFYGVDGNIACTGNMIISVGFYSNKTQLVLTITGNDEYSSEKQVLFFERYFSDNGIKLKVTEIF